MKHAHDILGVDRDADLDEIRWAYLRLAKAAHPDAGGSKEDFIRLQTAYEALIAGCNPPESARSDGEEASEEGANSSPEWKSYEDIMQAVRERLDRENVRASPADSHRQSHAAREFCGSIFLTLFCAGSLGAWLCDDGQSWDWGLWSYASAIALIVLVYICGLATVMAATPVTNSMAMYCRLMIVFFLIAAVMPLVLQPPGMPSPHSAPIISPELVPDWWPIPSRRDVELERILEPATTPNEPSTSITSGWDGSD